MAMKAQKKNVIVHEVEQKKGKTIKDHMLGCQDNEEHDLCGPETRLSGEQQWGPKRVRVCQTTKLRKLRGWKKIHEYPRPS